MPKHHPGRSNKLHAMSGRPYLSISETADYLGVTTRTVRQMVSDGRLTAYHLGARVVRLRRNEIDAAMQPFGGAAC
jgi:excisionase family DNA binding protein